MRLAIQSTKTDRRALVALCACTFLGSLAVLLPIAFLPKLADDLHSSVSVLGQIFTATLFISTLAGLAVGPLVDRIGARPLLAGGALAAALGLAIGGVAPSTPVFLTSALPGGLADAALLGLPLVVAASMKHDETGSSAIGWTVAASAAAPVLGVPAMVARGDQTGWRTAFLVTAGIAVIAAFAVAVCVAPRDRGIAPPAREPIARIYGALLRQRALRRLYLVAILVYLVWNAQLAFLGAFLSDHLHVSAIWIALAYPASGIAYFFGGLGGGRIAAPALRAVAAAMMLILGAAPAAAFALDHGPLLAVVLFAVTGFAAAIAAVAITALVADRVAGAGGTGVAITGVIATLGAALGGGFAGSLLALGGYRLLSLGLLVGGLLAAIALYATAPDERRKFGPIEQPSHAD
jgi:predicted MFS family arabinose efflux permease